MRTHASVDVWCAWVMADVEQAVAGESVVVVPREELLANVAHVNALQLAVAVANSERLSSLHVPAGWLCVPWTAMPEHVKELRPINSYGTPSASPIAWPYMQSRRAAVVGRPFSPPLP